MKPQKRCRFDGDIHLYARVAHAAHGTSQHFIRASETISRRHFTRAHAANDYQPGQCSLKEIDNSACRYALLVTFGCMSACCLRAALMAGFAHYALLSMLPRDRHCRHAIQRTNFTNIISAVHARAYRRASCRQPKHRLLADGILSFYTHRLTLTSRRGQHGEFTPI